MHSVQEKEKGKELAVALPLAEQDALLSQPCHPQVVVFQQEDLQLEQACLENLEPDTQGLKASEVQALTSAQDALLSQSCDAQEVVRRILEDLQLKQSCLNHPEPKTKKIIRCLARRAKCSSRLDVVKHLREVTPAGTTGTCSTDA